MLKIGITGGIGTGKTTVCKLFEKYGIPTYFADNRAKWLMNNSPIIKNKLIKNFGKKVFNEKGFLDKKYLGAIIFSDNSKLALINNIVHPAVFQDSQQWQEEQLKKQIPYTLKEAALLFESGSYQRLDKIIVVTAPLELRIQRVILRDNITAKEVMARIDKQMPQAEKEAKADFIITNIIQSDLEKQVKLLHHQLLGKIT